MLLNEKLPTVFNFDGSNIKKVWTRASKGYRSQWYWYLELSLMRLQIITMLL